VRKKGEGRRTHGYARPDEKEDPPWLDRAGRVEDALEKEWQGEAGAGSEFGSDARAGRFRRT
jgi:hypothetical protein